MKEFGLSTGWRPNGAEAVSRGGPKEVEDKYHPCGGLMCWVKKETQFSEAENLRPAGRGRVELCKGKGRGQLV